MNRNRHKATRQQTININTKSNVSNFINWVQRRLFLLKAKYCFQVSEEGEFVLLDSFLPTETGATISAAINGVKPLGTIDVEVMSDDTKGGINISYRYPAGLSKLVTTLILDMGIQYNSLESLPPEIVKDIQEPAPPNDASTVMELEFYLENVNVDHFSDWIVSEHRDILAKLFPAMGWVLEIQPPKLLIVSNFHRTILLEGRLYKDGSRGLALFTPNPLTDQDCICFETKQLSATRLHVLCRANKFAIEHFRELLGKIERNWPETRENIKRFLIDHKGESVTPICVSIGPRIEIATGKIIPEPEKYYRAEYKFKGTPLQFSVFITNYGKILSDKHRKDVVDLLESKSKMDAHSVEAKAIFFPLENLDNGRQKGVVGDIVVQLLPDQSSMLMVEAENHVWDRLQNTWNVIFSELKRQGWIEEEEQLLDRDGKDPSSIIDTKGNGNINVGGNITESTVITGNNNVIRIEQPGRKSKKKSE